MSTQQLLLVSPLQVLPTPALDNAQAGVPMRGTGYGEPFQVPQSIRTIAADGSLFSATNPTIETEITSHILGAWDATKPSFLLENGDSAGRKRVTMESLQFNYTVPPASGTLAYYAVLLDTGSATRYSSAGTTLAPVNATLFNTQTTVSRAYCGATVATAATSAVRKIGEGVFSSTIMVLGDQVLFTFGATNPTPGSILGGTVARQITVNCPPVILGQNDKLLFYMWYLNNAATAATWEITALWAER